MATSEGPKQGLNAALKKHLIQPFRLSKSKPKAKASIDISTLPEADGADDTLKSLPLFKYDSLASNVKRFRLLEILPGRSVEPVRVKLTSCNLDESPPYLALSYMWGRGDNHNYIDCEGKKLRTGENLWQFLRQYRDTISVQQYQSANPDVPVRLWIDALCINQDDIEERSSQVGQMRDIYTGADSVIVWLGQARGTEELAFLLTRFPHLLKVEEMATALLDLLNGPYWGRVWVVQEFVLAKSVEIWCGELRAGAANFDSIWRDENNLGGFSTLAQHIRNSRGWPLFEYRRNFRHTRKYRRELLGRRNSKTLKATFRLRDLIQSFSSSQSSEAYDKVYGFLGIAATGRGDQIRPDYAKTPVELLVDVIRNQCQSKTARGEEDNHGFFMYLMQMLKVSRMQFARHILQHAPDLKPFIYVFTVSEFLVASMSFVGTIIEAGSSVHRAEAFQDTMWTTGSLSRSPMHPNGLSNADIRDLGALVRYPETKLALDFEDYHLPNAVHRGKAEKLRQTVVAQTTESVVQCLIDDRAEEKEDKGKSNRTSDDISTKDLRQTFSRSFSNGTSQISSTRREQSEWDHQIRYEQYTTFLGTNKIIGMICTSGSADAPQVMAGDYIGVFTDDTVSKNALVIRHAGIENRWVIIGFAVIITSKAELEPRGVVRSLQQAFGKAVPQSRNDFNISDSALATTREETLCFHCHLTDLLELSRCGILNESQFDRLLDQSLLDDEDDEVHICSLGTGHNCVLDFGL